jgi:hypothetical protein
MSKLTKFTFDIKTKVRNQNANIKLPLNEEIQHSFVGRVYQQVFSYVNTNSSKREGECRIYSLPYDFEYFFNVDNSFQGGTFEKVRQLQMKDTVSFKYELFQRTSQDFPFLKYLYIINSRAKFSCIFSIIINVSTKEKTRKLESNELFSLIIDIFFS